MNFNKILKLLVQTAFLLKYITKINFLDNFSVFCMKSIDYVVLQLLLKIMLGHNLLCKQTCRTYFVCKKLLSNLILPHSFHCQQVRGVVPKSSDVFASYRPILHWHSHPNHHLQLKCKKILLETFY